MRRVVYVSGTRADFGLMADALRRAAARPGVELSVCVTGMHLSPLFGSTVADIEASGLRVSARIPTVVDDCSGFAMATAIGQALIGMTMAFQEQRPDLVVVLGDRGEMLAGALAATHLNIHVAHIHGGERSGTIDEPVRHAISKVAHYHFVATAGARERLVRMGEQPTRIHVTGAPGLDELATLPRTGRDELCAALQLDASRPIALAVFHPVVQEQAQAGAQMQTLLDALLGMDLQVVCLTPNSDAGGKAILETIERLRGHPSLRVRVHMPRQEFISWMAAADVMVGNSSSGVIEAASLDQWVVNVGSRQDGRERSGNVIDVPVDGALIRAACGRVLASGRRTWGNVYGDGGAGERIADLIERLPLAPEVLMKANAY